MNKYLNKTQKEIDSIVDVKLHVRIRFVDIKKWFKHAKDRVKSIWSKGDSRRGR